MRLLEFDNASSGANPQAAILSQKPAKKLQKKTASRKGGGGRRSGHSDPVFPISGNNAVKKPVRRNPIDLEQLQQRIEVLERRLRDRSRDENRSAQIRDLEQLKQRMKLLERSVHNELWAARQREHTLLELLARPPLKTQIINKARKFRTTTLPQIGRCLQNGCNEWWHDNQPLWWPRFARAWQESLDKARGIHPS